MVANPERWMSEALAEARFAGQQGEVPVGAVIVLNGEIVSRAHNEIEQLHDATAHAEMLAIQRASARLGTWRLNEAALFVTLEPCPMCIGAIGLARVKELYFGCYDPKQGAVGSLFDLSRHESLPYSIEVYPQLLEHESREVLKGFFKDRRLDAER